MLIQILAHTPRWVFVLFAVLLWYGSRQLLASRVSLTRITLMPLAMAGFAIYGVTSIFGDSMPALAGWAVAALIFAAVVLQRPLPAAARYDTAKRGFELPGSTVPLALMMGIFFTKYALGVALAMHPELRQQPLLAIGVPTFFGAFSGIFIGRALRLWKLAIGLDRGLSELRAGA